MPDPKAAPAAETKTVSMTAAELESLLADVAKQAASGGQQLPPGAYREGGRVWRDCYVPATGRTLPDGTVQQGLRKVQRPVMLVYDQSPEGLLRAQDAAYRASPQQDVYHPEYGWLRFGRKREVDVPENLGADLDNGDVIYVPIEDGDPRSGIPLPESARAQAAADKEA